MSRPRFLADHDLNEHIVDGLLRREPTIEISRARDHGLHERPDAELLEFAAARGILVVSHDVNTMPDAAYRRLASGQRLPGLLMASQSLPVAAVIDDLLTIWSASEAEEMEGQVWFLPI